MEIECLHRGGGWKSKNSTGYDRRGDFSGTTPNAQWNPLKFCSK